MKLKKGFIWKSIEGPSKGKEFTIIDINSDIIQYKSLETGAIYKEPRKNFEKRMERVSAFWNKSTKEYKKRKESLKGE